jgi:hypothetical protein
MVTKTGSPEKSERLAARKKAAQTRVQAQRQQATELRRLAQHLHARKKRGDVQAALEIDNLCATSLSFRRVWSSLIVEKKRYTRAPGSEKFAPGSRSVPGGRMNPR